MKKKVIWIVVAVLVILAAVAGILYYTTDLFKSPEQLFYRHLANNSKLLGETNYEDIIAELKKEAEGSMEIEGTITAKITSDDEDVKELATVLEKGKIKYNTKTVGSEKKMQNDITLNYDGKDIVTLNILQNKEQYGLKIAEAYDKYISVENSNLKALFQKLGVDTTDIPDKIPTVDYYELLNIDKETLNHVKTTYSDIIKQNIPQECYTVEKNATTKINGSDIVTNAYKLTLSEEQVKTVLVKVFETLKSDDKTLDLIVSKSNAMVEPYKDITEVDILTKEELVKGIEDGLAQLNEIEVTANKALEIAVYATKDGKATITIIAEEEAKQVANMKIDMIKNESNKGVIINYSNEDTTIEIMMPYNDKEVNALMTVESNGTKIQVTVRQEIKATENVTIEDFNSNNSVKLNDMSQAEMGQLVQTIYTNVMKVLPEKMELLGINPSILNSSL